MVSEIRILKAVQEVALSVVELSEALFSRLEHNREKVFNRRHKERIVHVLFQLADYRLFSERHGVDPSLLPVTRQCLIEIMLRTTRDPPQTLDTWLGQLLDHFFAIGFIKDRHVAEPNAPIELTSEGLSYVRQKIAPRFQQAVRLLFWLVEAHEKNYLCGILHEMRHGSNDVPDKLFEAVPGRSFVKGVGFASCAPPEIDDPRHVAAIHRELMMCRHFGSAEELLVSALLMTGLRPKIEAIPQVDEAKFFRILGKIESGRVMVIDMTKLWDSEGARGMSTIEALRVLIEIEEQRRRLEKRARDPEDPETR